MKSRHGFTLIELLVVIAIIAVLVALLLPAVNAAREAARMTQCKNNIRQIGLAALLYEGTYHTLPTGWISEGDTNEPGWGWAALLLPYLEEEAIVDRHIHLSLPIADPSHAAARLSVVATYTCPSDPTPVVVPLLREDSSKLFDIARANYAGMFGTREIEDDPDNGDGILFRNSRIRLKDIVDGLSKTIMVGERSSRLGHTIWSGVVAEADEAASRIVGSTDHQPNSVANHFDDFSSHHPTGAHFVNGDGSVRLLTDEIDLAVYQALATRAGREFVAAP
jgi:prepilin-type N-terminal cleavage/methylation domain-containing protein